MPSIIGRQNEKIDLGDRIMMNSWSFQKEFPKIYRDFFSKNELVVSAPGTFFWSGEMATTHSGLAILQKLPLRVYVGLSRDDSKKIKLGSFQFFSPSDKEFRSWIFEEPAASKLTGFLNSYIDEIVPSANQGWIVRVLTEVPGEVGLNSSGAISVAFATALVSLSEKFTARDMIKIARLPGPKIPQNRLFNKIFRLAWKIQSIFHASQGAGSTVFAPLIDGEYPVAYCSERQDWSDKSSISQPSFFGYRLNEFFNLKEPISFFPYDFGLIYSGDMRVTSSVLQSAHAIKATLAEISPMVKKWTKKIPLNKWDKKPVFLEFCQRRGLQPGQELFEEYLDALAVVSLEATRAFYKLYTQGLSEQALKSLFRAINSNQDILRLLTFSSPIIDYICHHLSQEVLKIGDDYGVGCKSTGSGKKGDVLFVVAFHGLRDQIFRTLEDMRRETGENIYLDYASWLDGIGKKGVRLNQDINQEHYSQFISPQTLVLKKATLDGIKDEIKTAAEFRPAKIDLLIDRPANKIFIRGKKLTSQEIPSTKATIKILGKLIRNLGKNIRAENLPRSTYSQDRNEMQSKIISPLKKAVKNKTKKDLNIKLTGTLTDFYLKLRPSKLKIVILEKVL